MASKTHLEKYFSDKATTDDICSYDNSCAKEKLIINRKLSHENESKELAHTVEYEINTLEVFLIWRCLCGMQRQRTFP